MAQELKEAGSTARVDHLESELARERANSSQLGRDLAAVEGQQQQGNDLQRKHTELVKEAEKARSDLVDARTDLSLERGEVKKLRKMRDDHEAVLARQKDGAASIEKAHADAAKWREAALAAMAQVKSSVRILVTAPKVSINIGKTEFSVQKAIDRDIDKIRGVVSDRVLPGFQRILAIAEEQGEEDIRKDVGKLVEELAVAVQQEVYRVIPQAEGTTSWDGFGAKQSRLNG